MCHVPVMRTAPAPSRIAKGGRNHGQSRRSAHPPASTVTCLQAWGNAGGLRVLSALRRDRDKLLLLLLLCFAFRATTSSHYFTWTTEYLPVWRRHRAHSVDVSAIIFATTAQLRLQAIAMAKYRGSFVSECVGFLLSLSLNQRPTLTFIRHRRYVTSATGNVTT